MTFGSVCSGIEAATVAWAPLGWESLWLAEIDAFPCALLKHYYPEVLNYGDFTKIRDAKRPDILVGGTPCQSFSVAGKRGGLDDPRGVLAFEFLALAGRIQPTWIVFENVPGLLSSDEGRDFGAFVGALGKLGYGWAYRVLDAQYFGLAQRRERVFVVGYLGDWRPPAAVLFEPESLQRNSPPSRETREDPTRSVAPCLTGNYGKQPDSSDTNLGPMLVTHSLRADGFDASEDGTGRGTPLVTCTVPADHNIEARRDQESMLVAFDTTQITSVANRSVPKPGDPCHPLASSAHPPAIGFYANDFGGDATAQLMPTLRAMEGGGGNHPAVAFQEAQTGCREYPTAGTLRANGPGHDPVGTRVRTQMGVRRLTPRECERLQGFPDDYTLIPYRKKLAADGPRYKAIGNSMAVPVVRWIGRRIMEAVAP